MSYSLQIVGLDGRTRRQCVNVCDICLSWPKSELHVLVNLSSQERILWLSTGLWSWEEGFLREKLTSWKRYHRTKKRFKKEGMNLPEVVSFQTSLMSSSTAQDLGLANVLLTSLSHRCEDRCCACVRLGWSRLCGCLTTVSMLCPSKTQTHQIHAKHLTSWGEL